MTSTADSISRGRSESSRASSAEQLGTQVGSALANSTVETTTGLINSRKADALVVHQLAMHRHLGWVLARSRLARPMLMAHRAACSIREDISTASSITVLRNAEK